MNAPVEVFHDEMGRLVSARFESALPQAGTGQRWLLAVDGSPHSLRAVEHALKMARAGELSLELITVLPWCSKEASVELPAHGWVHLADACARLDEAGLPWRAVVVMGEPAEAIVEAGKSMDAIVIGSHGRGAIPAMVMGSVALQVLHASRTSVWVVR
jgi:nucleotide-binding universal stress UspA family protein